MEIGEIRKRWTRSPGDVQAEVAAWDTVAPEFARDSSHTFETDPFLRFLCEKVPLDENMRVLDVGCGAGAYSEVMAGRTGTVDGVDFSPEMVRLAQRSAADTGIANVRYLKRDWHSCDGREFRGRYDLAFAHTTPAVVDYDTFMKLYDSSRQYGLFCRPARRTDRVFDEVHRMAGIPDRRADDCIPWIFELLWALGCRPETSYADVVWHPRRTLEEASVWYLGRLKGLDRSTEKKILDYLKSCMRNGVIEEEIHTTLVTIFWEKSEG